MRPGSLDESFDPARFLAESSARTQRLVPHDRVFIALRQDDGQTLSVFAEWAVRGSLLGGSSYYTAAFERGRRVPTDIFALAPVFEGDTQLIADMATDERFADDSTRRHTSAAGLDRSGPAGTPRRLPPRLRRNSRGTIGSSDGERR